MVYPMCFGRKWNPSAVECSGGFTKEPRKFMSTCEHYEKCSARTMDRLIDKDLKDAQSSPDRSLT